MALSFAPLHRARRLRPFCGNVACGKLLQNLYSCNTLFARFARTSPLANLACVSGCSRLQAAYPVLSRFLHRVSSSRWVP